MKTLLKYGSFFAVALLLIAVQAADQVNLRPVAADFATVVPVATRRVPVPCELPLISLAKAPQRLTPVSDALVVVGTKPCGQSEVGIWAFRFPGAAAADAPYQLLMKTFTPTDLRDTIN